MPTVDVEVSSLVSRSIRCRQVETMFDVPPQERQTLRWTGAVPLDEKPWNVGLIVGPSGSGKTTVARSLFGADAIAPRQKWGAPSVLDDFPKEYSVEAISQICQAVGFNTVPAWLRPFAVLSNGEQFRVSLARTLLEAKELSVVDEFTSVVDRQVAKIGAHAVQKHVRKTGGRFVAVSCHYDIVEWLNPDWILEPATMSFTWRELQRRPAIECRIEKVDYSAWKLFAPFHYMSAELHRAASCFVLFVGMEPAAFAGVLYRPHQTTTNIWGLSRLVTLPDFQGLGLAFVLSDALASAFSALGQRFHTYPAHPALIRSFDRSPKWKLQRGPGLIAKNRTQHASIGTMGGRPCAVFEYAGEPMQDRAEAQKLLDIPTLRPRGRTREQGEQRGR